MSEIYSYTVPHSGVNTTYYFEDTDLRNRISDAEAYVGYTDSDIAGLEVDYENNTFTRLAGAVGKSGGSDFNVFPTYAGMRRCILADDGTVVAYYGDSGYVEDGSAGQVMVEIPKFYYKVVPMKLIKNTEANTAKGYHIAKARYYISATPKTGFKLHPLFINNGVEINKAYMSAYEGSIYDTSASEYLIEDEQVMDTTTDKLSSISGVKPASGSEQHLDRPNTRTLCHNRGSHWEMSSTQMICAIYLLFIVEYGSCNLQANLGLGVVSISNSVSQSCASYTGSTSSLGNATGVATSTKDYSGTQQNAEGKVAVSYRGIENFYGNIWKWIDGINIKGNATTGCGIPYICIDNNFVDEKGTDNYISADFSLTDTVSFVKYFGYGNPDFDWLFMVSKSGSGANSSLPVGDMDYTATDSDDFGIVYFGGMWLSDTHAGLSWGYNHTTTTYDCMCGARLMYLPTA